MLNLLAVALVYGGLLGMLAGARVRRLLAPDLSGQRADPYHVAARDPLPRRGLTCS